MVCTKIHEYITFPLLFLYKKPTNTSLCVCVVICMCVCVLCEYSVHGSLKKALDPMDLELQMMVRYPVFRCGIRNNTQVLWKRTGSTLNW